MRRFWAFIIMVASLLVMVLFNVQAVYQANNLSLEYDGGTEVVLKLTKRTEGEGLDEKDISSKIAGRLDEAGARNSLVRIVLDDSDSGYARISLAGKTASAIDNIVRVVKANRPLTFTTATDYEVSGENIFGDKDPAQLKFNGTTPVVCLNVGKTDQWDTLTGKAKEATDTAVQTKIYLWQNKAETDNYENSLGKDKRSEITKKIIATLDTSNYTTNNDENYITVANDENGAAFTIASARAYVNARNSADYGFDIDYLYENLIVATYPANAMMSSLIGTLVGLVLLFIGLVLAYKVSGAIEGLTITMGTMFTMLIANFLGFEFTPITILAAITGILLSVFIITNYLERVKEEVSRGKSPEKANYDGYRKAFAVTLESSAFVFFVALLVFLTGQGLLKTFAGILMISALMSFLVVNYFTKWLMYWLTTSTAFAKSEKFFGLSEEPKLMKALKEKSSTIQEGKMKKKKNLSFIYAGVVLLLCLGGFLGSGLINGSDKIFNNSGDYADQTRVNITYMTLRTISDEESYVKISDFEDDVCDKQKIFPKDNIVSYTFNRLETEDDNKVETYTVYISLLLNTKLTDDQFQALDTYFQGGTDLNMIPTSYPTDYTASTKVNQDISYSGKIIHDNFWAYLAIGLIPAFTFVFFLVVHGLYAALAAGLEQGLVFGLGMGLLAACRLPFNSTSLYGVMALLFISSIAMLPLFCRYREAKRDSATKLPSLEQRSEFLTVASKSALIPVGTLLCGTILLLVGLLASCGDSLLSMCVIGLVLALFSLYFTLDVLPYDYLFFVDLIRLRPLRLNRTHKKLEVNKNEPHETIIPGIND
ncbi:MAG: hypothetical protein LKJ88_04620 [Bacilli bacterium]|nr:hypothetical protein [Bacilli bacterium]